MLLESKCIFDMYLLNYWNTMKNKISFCIIFNSNNIFIRNFHLGGSFYMRTERLRGYSILVSNDTVLTPSESSCYTDPGNFTLPNIIEKNCERTARYAWIYQDKRSQCSRYVKYKCLVIFPTSFISKIKVQNDSLDTLSGFPWHSVASTRVCFTDPGNVTLPTVIEKDCERTARYIWIYQNNSWDWHCPMLEICELQVFVKWQ